MSFVNSEFYSIPIWMPFLLFSGLTVPAPASMAPGPWETPASAV